MQSIYNIILVKEVTLCSCINCKDKVPISSEFCWILLQEFGQMQGGQVEEHLMMPPFEFSAIKFS